MFIWEPTLVKCPDCGKVFYFPCDPDDFYGCGEHPPKKETPPLLQEAHPEVHEDDSET